MRLSVFRQFNRHHSTASFHDRQSCIRREEPKNGPSPALRTGAEAGEFRAGVGKAGLGELLAFRDGDGEASAGQVEFVEPGVGDAAEVQCVGLAPGVLACRLGINRPFLGRSRRFQSFVTRPLSVALAESAKPPAVASQILPPAASGKLRSSPHSLS